MKHLTVKFYDSGQHATQPPNPNYPKGINLDVTNGTLPSCYTELPYPSPGVGYILITCERCGFHGVVTAAGRSDDPRSIRVPCKFTQ